MTTKTKKQFDTTKGFMIIVIALLLLVVITLILMYPRSVKSPSAKISAVVGAQVNIGAFEYNFVDGKAVKRSDSAVQQLRSFLTDAANKDISSNCPVSYYAVNQVSTDENQVLLNYGCIQAGARMFAVKDNDGWKFISPSNQFDTFGIPTCTTVNDNNISPSIAPICGTESMSQPSKINYSVRT